jgi:hypothetical protein
MLQFSGVGSVPVAAQSALLAFVDDQLPLSYISANVTGVAPKGNRTFDVAVRFVIGKSLQAFSPQVQLLYIPHALPGNVPALICRAAKALQLPRVAAAPHAF